MKLVITGANSYVGARLYVDLKPMHTVIGTYAHHQLFPELLHLDITNTRSVQEFITAQSPDIIIHAQANANARWCDAHPEEAIEVNQEATQKIVAAANLVSAKVIYISSFAAINPSTLYGRTKLASEEYVKQTNAGYLILRPSFILGFSPNTANDRPFNRLLKNLDQKTPAIYDTSWKFYPTYVHHMSEVIQGCIEKSIWNKTLPVVVPEEKTRFETARDILLPFGVPVEPVDNHDTTPNHAYDQSELSRLGLPHYTYQEMIEAIHEEIRHRERFGQSLV